MRILLSIEYDGKNYYGWQEQKDPNTIQGKIQEAIFKFSQENIKLFVAGRTDAGVHATGQIAHFDSQVSRSEDSWLFGLNTYLPEDIKIKFVKFVDDDFHARFSAINRTYRYVIYNNKVKPCIYRNKVAWYYLKNLDEGFKLLLSNYFVEFNSSRSDYSSIEDNNGLNFYGNSESFLNFFDESLNGCHVVKINIGEIKFDEAVHKLDSLCLEKKVVPETNIHNQSFSIQSGSIFL